MNKIKVGFFIFLILVLLIEIALLSQAIFYPPTKPVLVSNIAPTQTPSAQPPYSPVGFEWREINTNDPKSLTKDLAKSLLYSKTGDLIALSKVTGKEWMATKKFSTIELLNSVNFKNNYVKILKDNGWSNEITVDGKPIMAIVADGPTGGTWGFGNVTDAKLNIIVIQDLTNFTDNKSSKNTPPFSCPCTTVYRVFISDAIPTSEILK